MERKKGTAGMGYLVRRAKKQKGKDMPQEKEDETRLI